MALSVIEPKDIAEYGLTLNYLASDKMDWAVKGAANMMAYDQGSNYFEDPMVLLIRKRNPDPSIATHVFVLVFKNLTYEIKLPFHLKDWRFLRLPMANLWFPPCFATPANSVNTPVTSHFYDLSSNDL